MTHPIVSLNTARTSASQRSAYWAGALGTLCGPLQAEALGAGALDGRIDYATLQRLRLCHIEVSGHRIMHAATAAAGAGDPVIKVVFQTSGTSVFEQDERRLVIRPGDCLVYDVSQPHVITSLAPTKHNVIIVPKSLMAQRGAPAGALHAQQASAREGAGRLAHDFLMSAFSQAPGLAAGLELQVAETLLDLAVLPFFTAQDHEAPGRDGLRQRIKALVQERLGDPDLSIEHISSSLGCTKRYLHMSFADEGMTITRYIWQQRLEKCLAELELGPRPGRSLTDIAFSWGFNSSSHFAHLFKKQYGIAPSAVQRQGGREVTRVLAPAVEI